MWTGDGTLEGEAAITVTTTGYKYLTMDYNDGAGMILDHTLTTGASFTNWRNAAGGFLQLAAYSSAYPSAGLFGLTSNYFEISTSVVNSSGLNIGTSGAHPIRLGTNNIISATINATTQDWLFNNKKLSGISNLSVATQTPASAGAAGTTGTITWDTNYIYICTATNTWKRVAIATW